VHDVIVVGARCAGAATAMLLARRGLDVLLVDRARLPSEIRHGHFIHRHGPRRLSDWGLLDRVLATGCPAVTSIVTDFGDFPLEGDDLSMDGIPVGLGPRRRDLDAVLADAAVEAGAELRDGYAVRDLVFEDDRVVGVQSDDGAERARFVVGADGRGSGVARRVQAPEHEVVPTLTCWYFSYWSSVSGDALEIYDRNRRVVFAFPTNDGLFAVFCAWPIEELDSVRGETETAILEALDGCPDLAERVRAGNREERIYGAVQLPNFLRKPYGPGWALVGDAGCHKDPYRALGVCDAFRDAELLAGALAEVVGGTGAEEELLAGYERARNDATLPDYQANIRQAHLEPAPQELLGLRAAVRGNPEATKRLYLTMEGLIEPGPPPA
jgi:flavin-dependent dehydrogenase